MDDFIDFIVKAKLIIDDGIGVDEESHYNSGLGGMFYSKAIST
jgi:hypothetical protein